MPLSSCATLGQLTLEGATVLEMDTSSSSFDPNDGFIVTSPFPSSPMPMHVSLRDDKSFNLPMLTKLTTRNPWRKFLPREHVSNVWTLAIDDEEPINASGTIDTLNFIRNNHHTIFTIKFHKRITCSGTLLNEHRSLFDQFKRLRPNKIHKNTQQKDCYYE